MLSSEVSLNIEITSGDVLEAHRERLEQAGQVGFAYSQEEVPHDTGTLKASGFPPEWRDRGLVLGYSARHAAPLEYGTEPGHTPPIEPLRRWAERIGKDPGFGVWVATEKIPSEGVDSSPYMRPSAERMRRWLDSHPLDLE